MSNSQGRRREIIPLDEFPRSSTPEPSPKKQKTSRTTSKNIVNQAKDSRSRVTRSTGAVEPAEPPRVKDSAGWSSDPLRHRSKGRVERAEPTRAKGSSERSSDPLEDRSAPPEVDPEEAAIEDSPREDSPREGAEGTASTRTADSDGGATSEQMSSSSRLISELLSLHEPRVPRREPRAPRRGPASPLMALWRRRPENRRLIAKGGLDQQLCGDRASLYDQLLRTNARHPGGWTQRSRRQVKSPGYRRASFRTSC